MFKRKMLISLIFVLVSAVLLTFYWAYHHKILSGNYDKLTINGMDGATIQVIQEPDEIAKIISAINESQRTFMYNNGFKYDHLPHGILTFENNTEQVEIGIILTNGKTITKYWEIDTEFPFGKNGG